MFSSTLAGAEHVIYSFPVGANHAGNYPRGGLVDIGGTLHGVTAVGGAADNSTVLVVTP